MADGTRLRIAIFASNYPPHLGGLEIVVWQLARGMAERHDVVLVTSAFGEVTGIRQEDGLTVHRLPTVHLTERFGVPYPVPTGRGLRAALRDVDSVDIVHAHGALYLQTMLARWVARREGVPLVLTEHVGFVQYRSAVLNAVQRGAWSVIGSPLVRHASAVVTYNARVHAQLARESERDVRFVGNGVDSERFRSRSREERAAARRSFGLAETGTLALFVGRESEKKNLDILLRAARDDYTLVVCGAARDLTGPGLVDLGVLPYERMAELFGCVDLMVHPASGEGFPLAVQEAIASGVPVVLLWDDGYARWMTRSLVEACETPNEVVPALEALVRDPDRRTAMADTGRAWARKYWSWNATVDAYEEIYREVINGASRA